MVHVGHILCATEVILSFSHRNHQCPEVVEDESQVDSGPNGGSIEDLLLVLVAIECVG